LQHGVICVFIIFFAPDCPVYKFHQT
jgi:hypothetical protein